MSLAESFETFIESADWLTDSEAALVASCRVMAVTLDAQLSKGELVPALMSQYNLTVARLHKLKPKPVPPKPEPAPEPPKPELEGLLDTALTDPLEYRGDGR